MQRKTATKTIPRSTRHIATLRLSQAHGKRLAEVLDKMARGYIFQITSEGRGEEDRTTTITVLPASKAQDCGLAPGSFKDVAEIREF